MLEAKDSGELCHLYSDASMGLFSVPCVRQLSSSSLRAVCSWGVLLGSCLVINTKDVAVHRHTEFHCARSSVHTYVVECNPQVTAG